MNIYCGRLHKVDKLPEIKNEPRLYIFFLATHCLFVI